MADRYEEQRKRNDKARDAAREAGKSQKWFRRVTSDALGRPSDNDSEWNKDDVKPMSNRKVGLPDDLDSSEEWDSGNPDGPIGHD